MSFILKALKKVEEEKAARGDGPVDLNSALLRSGRASAHAAPRLARWGVIALVFGAGSGLTYFLVPKASGPSLETPKQATANPARPVSAAPPPPPFPTETMPAPQAATATVSRPGMMSGSPEEAVAPPPKKRARTVPEQPSRPAASQTAPSGLRVNGIAVQDDPAESVAVVNGALLKRGMSVEGARVEEIFQDRVRFSGNGGSFEVQLSR